MLGPLVGQEHKVLVDKTGGGTTGITAHKVRARVRYDPVTAITGQVNGPWRYMPGYMDGLGTHNNVPLPVELLDFNATCEGGRVHLTWATGSERNSSHFIVQRSSDGMAWEDIASLQAASNSQQMTQYTFVDEQALFTDPSYYRLVQWDHDGAMNVLPTTVVQGCDRIASLGIYPNPAEEATYVNVSLLHGGPGHLVLLDAAGRTLDSYTLLGITQRAAVPLAHLAAGCYLVQLFDEQQQLVGSGRVVRE